MYRRHDTGGWQGRAGAGAQPELNPCRKWKLRVRRSELRTEADKNGLAPVALPERVPVSKARLRKPTGQAAICYAEHQGLGSPFSGKERRLKQRQIAERRGPIPDWPGPRPAQGSTEQPSGAPPRSSLPEGHD